MAIKSKVLAAAATLTLVTGIAAAVPVTGAKAASISCTTTPSCGGATLMYSAKGSLDLAVLSPDASTNGGFGYWSEHVGFSTSTINNPYEDFIVAQQSGEVVGKGGAYGLGNYAVFLAPAGHVPDDINFGGTGSQTAYCISVMDTYPTVRGKVVQRWALVLRSCDTIVAGARAPPKFCPPSSQRQPEGCNNPTDEWVVINPNPYQTWSPTQGAANTLLFQNLGLNMASLRHGFGGKNFVMDDRANGGNGTWGIAYPENDQPNQRFSKINACTDPVKQFNPIYWACVS
jgi:hypothetical protein